MTRLAPLVCRLAGHTDLLDVTAAGLRARCTRCDRVTPGIYTAGGPMTASHTETRLAGFELSQIAAEIARQIHRADVLRGEAPDVAFPELELPVRRHYLSLGEKAILLRPDRDRVVGVDQHREQARASLRAIQANRAFCLVPPRRARAASGGGQ